ncbi:MAG: spore cortex biosynthesis protein YabQ [Clostridiales bacterium]|nr:spore cortex biosynthesis protein YabQ [Clostridiales bacterium]
MAEQARLFLWTMILGAVTGVAFDFFRIARITVKHPDFLTQIEDLLYWLFASVLIFYFILHRNSGEVRIYAIIGVFSGMCLYFISLSGVIIKTTIFIIDIIKKIIITTVNIIMFPFKLLINLLSYPVRAIIKWSLKRAAHGKSIARKANRFAKIKMRNFKKEIYIIRKKI